jgi:cell division protein FtsW
VNKELSKVDNPLFISAVLLTLGGLIMIYSGSSVLAYESYSDGAFFFKRQFMWLVLGLAAGIFFYRTEPEKIKQFITPLLIGSIILLFAVHFPGLGRRVGGAIRWIKIGPFSFQPFEAVKLFYILYLAFVFASDKLDSKIKLTRAVIVTAVIGAGLIWQRDLGGAAIIALLFLGMIVVGGFDLKYLLFFVPVLFAGLVYFIKVEPYRLKRILTFLDPWQDPLGAGWQTIQSLIAIGSGGPLGVGIFESQQKFYYLPTPHTDYIFAIIGEELGLWGALLVIVGFFFILQRGLYIALHVNEVFLKYTAAGATMMIVMQALANVYVATGLMPPKGTTLPFLSFGGSSLIVNIAAVALLLSISKRLRGGRA